MVKEAFTGYFLIIIVNNYSNIDQKMVGAIGQQSF